MWSGRGCHLPDPARHLADSLVGLAWLTCWRACRLAVSTWGRLARSLASTKLANFLRFTEGPIIADPIIAYLVSREIRLGFDGPLGPSSQTPSSPTLFLGKTRGKHQSKRVGFDGPLGETQTNSTFGGPGGLPALVPAAPKLELWRGMALIGHSDVGAQT